MRISRHGGAIRQQSTHSGPGRQWRIHQHRPRLGLGRYVRHLCVRHDKRCASEPGGHNCPGRNETLPLVEDAALHRRPVRGCVRRSRFLSRSTITNGSNSILAWTIRRRCSRRFRPCRVSGRDFDQVVGTALLVGLILAVGDKLNINPASNLAPIVIGLLVVAIGISWAACRATPSIRRVTSALDLFAVVAGFKNNGLTDGSGIWLPPVLGPIVGGLAGAFAYDLAIGRAIERSHALAATVEGWTRPTMKQPCGRHRPYHAQLPSRPRPGTTSSRAILFDHRAPRASPKEFPQISRRPAGSSTTRGRSGTRRQRHAEVLSRAGSGRRRGRDRHHQPAGDDDPLGPPDRRAGPQRDRLAGPPDGRRSATSSSATATATGPAEDRAGDRRLFLRQQGALAARQRPRRPQRAERGELAFGTVDTWLHLEADRRRACTSPMRPTPRGRCSTTSTRGNGTTSCCALLQRAAGGAAAGAVVERGVRRDPAGAVRRPGMPHRGHRRGPAGGPVRPDLLRAAGWPRTPTAPAASC